ncbi:hypothetical protein SLEP1_g51215 [Rubroshorea leprosula]|uniref:Uncharacterized protein n=1 Tax=Rubroshorea leprosula TaxID=152421 RepID=A0AAV5M5R1_9ROSI|nr:hypothetical protein SLEP1_g51215 [Rubroshorea leprosula]
MKFLPFLVQSQDLGLRILSLNPEISDLLCFFLPRPSGSAGFESFGFFCCRESSISSPSASFPVRTGAACRSFLVPDRSVS